MFNRAGIQTVELALTLPLVLFIIFGTIDVARIVAAYSSVRTATAIGTRQAIGELRSEPAGVQSLMGGAGSDYYQHDMADTNWATSNVYTSPWTAPSAATNTHYKNSCDGRPLTTLYRYEARALAWANYIQHSNFPKASYPCDPARPEEQCFSCCILRNSNALYERIFSVPSIAGGGSPPFYAAKFVAIQCTQQVPMTTSSIGLGALNKFVAVTASAYIPVNNYAGNHFNVVQ